MGAAKRKIVSGTALSSAPIAVDLFSGVGGMSLGFHQAGFNVVASVDNDALNSEMYKKNFPGASCITADVSTISGKDIRARANIGDSEICVLFGGPPCQGFSFIGKRNANDPRNQLLQQFARLVDELKPRYFVVENVRGILSGYARIAVDSFVKAVRKSGYSVVEPIQYLEAQNYGVPQKRQRVFILGYRADVAAPSYPKATNGGTTGVPFVSVWDGIKDLPDVDKFSQLLASDQYSGVLGEASDYGKMMRGEIADSHFSGKTHKKSSVLTGNLRTEHGIESRKRFRSTQQGTVESVSRFFRLSKNGLANTIRAGTGPHAGGYTAPRPIHPTQARCITVREAARLHSFPDWFRFHPTKWHGFRQVGNAVPPRLAHAVASEIFKAAKLSRPEVSKSRMIIKSEHRAVTDVA